MATAAEPRPNRHRATTFLLFLLAVAAGVLALLWLYFPMQLGPPPGPAPLAQPPVAASSASPQSMAVPDAVPPVAPAAPAGADPGTGASAGDPALPQPEDTAPRAAPGGTAPERIDIDDLRRQLERLLGNTLPPAQ